MGECSISGLTPGSGLASRDPEHLGGAVRPLPVPRVRGYTNGMKTAISLADEIFEQAERLARRLKKSRSELYRAAIAEYVARHDAEAVTEAMNRIAEQADTRLDAFSAEAARGVLERSEW
jgi:predicted transcriptional regulator